MFKNSQEPKSLKPVGASCADCFIYSCFFFMFLPLTGDLCSCSSTFSNQQHLICMIYHHHLLYPVVFVRTEQSLTQHSQTPALMLLNC